MAMYRDLAAFIVLEDLKALLCCNSNLRQLFPPLFVSRAVWPSVRFQLLGAQERSYVRRMRVANLAEVRSCYNQLTSLDIAAVQLLQSGDLPPRLTHLKLGSYDHVLAKDVLPTDLTTLRFQYEDSQRIEVGALPTSLRVLHFELSRVLPAGLSQLRMGYYFNAPIGVGVLPSSLTTLALGIFSISAWRWVCCQ